MKTNLNALEIDLVKVTPTPGDMFVIKANKELNALERQELIRRFLDLTQRLKWPQVGVVFLDAGTDISVISKPPEVQAKP